MSTLAFKQSNPKILESVKLNEDKKGFWQDPKFQKGILVFLLSILCSFGLYELNPFNLFSVKENIENHTETKDDDTLFRELAENPLQYSGNLERMSAALRKCSQGNEKACELLARIAKSGRNKNFTAFYGTNNPPVDNLRDLSDETKRYLKKKGYAFLRDIYQKGSEGFKESIGRSKYGMVPTVAWILLQHGYDPMTWYGIQTVSSGSGDADARDEIKSTEVSNRVFEILQGKRVITVSQLFRLKKSGLESLPGRKMTRKDISEIKELLKEHGYNPKEWEIEIEPKNVRLNDLESDGKISQKLWEVLTSTTGNIGLDKDLNGVWGAGRSSVPAEYQEQVERLLRESNYNVGDWNNR